MKFSKRQLRQIIKEEVEAAIDEGFMSRMGAKLGFAPKGSEEAMKYALNALDRGEDVLRSGTERPERLADAAASIQKTMGHAEDSLLTRGGTTEQVKTFRRYQRKASEVVKSLQSALDDIKGTDTVLSKTGGAYGWSEDPQISDPQMGRFPKRGEL